MHEVGPEGVVTSWTWVDEPNPNHPLDRPFAFALIQLDGADTAMVHVVDGWLEKRTVRSRSEAVHACMPTGAAGAAIAARSKGIVTMRATKYSRFMYIINQYVPLAMHCTLFMSYKIILKTLIAQGADAGGTNREGLTAMQLAEQKGHREAAALLKRHL